MYGVTGTQTPSPKCSLPPKAREPHCSKKQDKETNCGGDYFLSHSGFSLWIFTKSDQFNHGKANIKTDQIPQYICDKRYDIPKNHPKKRFPNFISWHYKRGLHILLK